MRDHLSPCSEPGCPNLTDQARCAIHRIRNGSSRQWRARRQRVLHRDQETCAYCGGPATTADHTIALVNGGPDSDLNCVASCARCNYTKGAA